MKDLRDDIFRDAMNRSVTAVIMADDAGIIAGTQEAAEKAESLGLFVIGMLQEGEAVQRSDEIARISGNPKQIAIAEDLLIGLIAKPSGIATATRKCVDRAGEQIRIVCGAWKKMPVILKDTIRKAVVVGGGHFRISEEAFIYLDKNYIRMLGGIRKSLEAVDHLTGYKKVVQIKGSQFDIATEACQAAKYNADVIFVDTGQPDDLHTVANALNREGLKDGITIAFGGNVKAEGIDRLKNMSVDILAIGRNIIDAPLLDLRLEIIEISG